MTVLEADCTGEISESGNNPLMSKLFGLMLEALDDLKKNEVSICTGSSSRYALWDELVSIRHMKCGAVGAVGAVINENSRDTRRILTLNFPTFSFGGYAQDPGPRRKLIDFRIPIEINGVRIEPGDIILRIRAVFALFQRKLKLNLFRVLL